ncbi:MAG TPA: LLM class flavin-dependent oxidoreductase [Candidatus Acidoferrales bacterium]|nr:LLM class flavin-dependent oxidoreductase [Candidatus Acidoferrales bacterium]
MSQVGFCFVNPAPEIDPCYLANFARRAEELGAHSLWVLDRIAYDNLEPLTALAAAAAVTKTVRLGTSVLLAATRQPAILAKTAATLDFLSGGRLILGIGVGSREADFLAAGVPFEHRGSRAEETVLLLKKLWTGAPVSHTGKFFSLKEATVGPRPIQSPHPPIWMGGGGTRAALRRIARLADGFICGSSGVPNFGAIWSEIAALAEQSGRSPAAIEKAGLTFMALDDDRARAAEVLAGYLRRYYGAVRGDVEKTYLVGSPEQCADKINGFFQSGLSTLIIGVAAPDLKQFDLFEKRALPRLAL